MTGDTTNHTMPWLPMMLLANNFLAPSAAARSRSPQHRHPQKLPFCVFLRIQPRLGQIRAMSELQILEATQHHTAPETAPYIGGDAAKDHTITQRKRRHSHKFMGRDGRIVYLGPAERLPLACTWLNYDVGAPS